MARTGKGKVTSRLGEPLGGGVWNRREKGTHIALAAALSFRHILCHEIFLGIFRRGERSAVAMWFALGVFPI
ncbi:hypothetical protein [Streptomyces pratensis]|uniref:hypothetical protein n=1 Tax=Streptomyces pratensis TaxID=1169025 RepID=UPI00301941AC